MDNHELAKREAQALKVFNPDTLEEIAKHYHLTVKKVYAWFRERALAE